MKVEMGKEHRKAGSKYGKISEDPHGSSAQPTIGEIPGFSDDFVQFCKLLKYMQ